MRPASSGTDTSLASCQPCKATIPSRASTETTTRPASGMRHTSATIAGFRTAAVPMTTRSTPASSHALAVSDAADAAPHLHRNVQHVDDGGDYLEVRRRAGGRSVQVYQVQAGTALPLPALCHGQGVIGEYGLPFEVALVQPHAPATAKVNGRDYFHSVHCTLPKTSQRKFSSPLRGDGQGEGVKAVDASVLIDAPNRPLPWPRSYDICAGLRARSSPGGTGWRPHYPWHRRCRKEGRIRWCQRPPPLPRVGRNSCGQNRSSCLNQSRSKAGCCPLRATLFHPMWGIFNEASVFFVGQTFHIARHNAEAFRSGFLVRPVQQELQSQANAEERPAAVGEIPQWLHQPSAA